MRWWRLLATAVTCAVLVLVSAVPAAASDQKDRDRDRNEDFGYLALGDSVAFGFSPLLDPRVAANFVGYPEALASRLDLKLTNASCPGEASGGFISLTGVDNVCRPYRFGSPAFPPGFPLHVAYTTSQLDFAVAFLRAHPRTRLVTLDIGANDFFVLQRTCAGVPTCIQAGFPGLLATLASNLTTIYGRLRNEAHYHHQLVGLTYYASNYNDLAGVAALQQINGVVAATTQAAHGTVADGFGAFKAVASTAAGDSCAAGLLIKTPGAPSPCDIHPSPRGRDVLAGAIATVVRHNHEDD
jgi:lysophospholipase L1-like esterase